MNCLTSFNISFDDIITLIVDYYGQIIRLFEFSTNSMTRIADKTGTTTYANDVGTNVTC